MNTTLKTVMKDLLTLETLIAFILAILIIFNFKIEESIQNVINTPLGMVFTMLFLILLFITLHPIIGILFVIYLFDTLRKGVYIGELQKNKLFKKLNHTNETHLEEKVIDDMAPIVNKNKNNNVPFMSNMVGSYSSYP
jgi:predicted membrane protein